MSRTLTISQWGCDWLFMNTDGVLATLCDAKGETGNTLGTVGYIKITNRSKKPATFHGAIFPYSFVTVAPGDVYFAALATGPAISVKADFSL